MDNNLENLSKAERDEIFIRFLKSFGRAEMRRDIDSENFDPSVMDLIIEPLRELVSEYREIEDTLSDFPDFMRMVIVRSWVGEKVPELKEFHYFHQIKNRDEDSLIEFAKRVLIENVYQKLGLLEN